MRLHGNKITLLDGGTGRELEAQGASIDPPLWSANAFYTDPERVNIRNRIGGPWNVGNRIRIGSQILRLRCRTFQEVIEFCLHFASREENASDGACCCPGVFLFYTAHSHAVVGSFDNTDNAKGFDMIFDLIDNALGEIFLNARHFSH